MTPEEIKSYVDSAVSHRDNFDLAYLVVTVVISGVTAYFTTYINEKGKNAATKEDIGHVTTEIEKSKSYFTERIEHLKADLSSRVHFGKVRYEREMKVFEDVWPKLCELKEAVRSLRPIMESALKEGETEESRKNKKNKRFLDSYGEFKKAVEHSRPFYPQSIWCELVTIIGLTWDEAVEFNYQRSDALDYWKKASENAEMISKQIDKTCEAIRSRLTAFDDA